MYRLPYNRFDETALASEVWWLSPQQESPAYRFGKLFVDREGDFLRVGYYVEKGFRGELDERKLVMDGSWYWSKRLMREIKQVDEALCQQSSLSSSLLWVRLDAHRYMDKDNKSRAHLEFVQTPAGLSKGRLWGGDALEKVQVDLAGQTKLQYLLHCLQDGQLSPENEWLWFDLTFFYKFSIPWNENTDAPSIWNQACKPWLKWLG